MPAGVPHNCFCERIDSHVNAKISNMRLTGSIKIAVEETIAIKLPLKSDCDCHPVGAQSMPPPPAAREQSVPIEQATRRAHGAFGGDFKQATFLETWAAVEDLCKLGGWDSKHTYMKLILDNTLVWEGTPTSEVIAGGVEHEKWRIPVESARFNKAQRVRAEFYGDSRSGKMMAHLEETGETFRKNGGFTSKLRITDEKLRVAYKK